MGDEWIAPLARPSEAATDIAMGEGEASVLSAILAQWLWTSEHCSGSR
jgi:hypothetical protein